MVPAPDCRTLTSSPLIWPDQRRCVKLSSCGYKRTRVLPCLCDVYEICFVDMLGTQPLLADLGGVPDFELSGFPGLLDEPFPNTLAQFLSNCSRDTARGRRLLPLLIVDFPFAEKDTFYPPAQTALSLLSSAPCPQGA